MPVSVQAYLREPERELGPWTGMQYSRGMMETPILGVASCRQQWRPFLGFLVAAGEAAVRGSPPPAPLPASQGG